jgi:hypothetical protein
LLFGLTWGAATGQWREPRVIIMLVAFVVLFVLFCYVETKAEAPIVPPHLLLIKNVGYGSLASFLLGASFMAQAAMTTFMELANGLSALQTGIRTIPYMVFSFVSTTFAYAVYYNTGSFNRFPAIGFLLCILGCLGFALTLSIDMSTGAIIGWSMPFGVGNGLAGMLNICAQNSVLRKDLATTTSLIIVTRDLGYAIGFAILHAVYMSELPGD